jgi:homoserine O-acetyltransferase/O-succinyltransferase
MALAQNHLQRQAIRNDPAWLGGLYPVDRQPSAGLALARAMALCTYKSSELFNARFARLPDRSGEDPQTSREGRYDVAGYLDYQGEIFTSRFDANSYLVLSKAMDTFDPAQTYGSDAAAWRRIRAHLLMVGISSDWLFPPGDVRAVADKARAAGVNAGYAELISSHGHDGFLADAGALAEIIDLHLEKEVLAGLQTNKREEAAVGETLVLT